MAKDDFDDIDLDFDLDDDFLKDLDNIKSGKKDPNINKKDRKAIDVIKDSAKNTKDFVVDNQLIEKAIKSSLPKELRQSGQDLTSFLNSLRDQASKSVAEVNKEVDTFKRTASQLARHYDKIVPKSVKEWLQQAEKKASSNRASYQEESEDEKIAKALNDVFVPQIELQKQQGQRELLRDQLEKRRFETQQDLLYGIKHYAGVQANYTSEITSRYQRKNLELQHKQLYLQSNILKTLLETQQHQKTALDALVKNTALPDIAKAHKSEIIREMGFRNLVDLGSKGFGSFVSGYKDQLSKNAGQMMKDTADNFVSGLSLATMMMDAHVMEQDMAQEFGEQKSIGARLGGKGASLLVNLLGNKLIAPKLKRNSKVAAITNLIGNKSGNIATTLNRFKNKYSDNLLINVLQELMPGGNEQYKRHDFASEGKLKDLAQFDIATRKSIVDVIPQLLAKIHQSTEGIRLGYSGKLKDDSLLEWDHNSAQLKTRKQIDRELLKKIDGKMNVSGQLSDAVMIVNSIDNEFQLSTEARSAFAKEIVARAGKWQGFDPTDYVNDSWKTKPNSLLIEEIRNFLRAKFLINSFDKYGSEKMDRKSLLDGNIQSILRKANEFQNRLETKRGEAQNYLINMSTSNDTMLRRHVRLGKAEIQDGVYGLTNNNNFYDINNLSRYDSELTDKRQRELKRIYETRGGLITRKEFEERKGYSKESDTVPNPLPELFLSGKPRLSYEELNFMLEDKKLASLDKEFTKNKNRLVDRAYGLFGKGRTVNNIKNSSTYQSTSDFVSKSINNIDNNISNISGIAKSVVDANIRQVKEKAKTGNYNFNLERVSAWIPKFVSMNNVKDIANLTRSIMECYSQVKNVSMEKVSKLLEKDPSKVIQELQEAGIPIAKDKAKEFIEFVETGVVETKDKGKLFYLDLAEDIRNSGVATNIAETIDVKGKSVNDVIQNVGQSFNSTRISDYIQQQVIAEEKVGSQGKTLWRSLTDRAKETKDAFLSKVCDVFVKGETTPRIIRSKLEAGEYINKATGETISSIGDINNEVIDKQGNTVLTANDLKRGIETNIGEDIPTQFKPVNQVLPQEVQRDFEAKVKRALTVTMRTTDVYTKDNPNEPALTRWGMMMGRYINSKGKVIDSPKDIDGAVYDREGNVIITEEQAAAGLVDKKGRPLRGYIIRRLRWAMDMHKAVYKPIIGAGKLAYNTASKIPFLRKLLPTNLIDRFTADADDRIDGLKGIAKSSGKAITGTAKFGYGLLNRIPYLRKILPGKVLTDVAGEDKQDQRSFFSTVASAIGVAKMFSDNESREKKRRKGNAEDILAEQDSAYEAKRRAKEGSKNQKEGKEDNGILGFLKNAFPFIGSILGGVSTVLGSIGSVATGIFSILGNIASLFGLGKAVSAISGAVKTAAGVIPGAKAISSVLGKKAVTSTATKTASKLAKKGFLAKGGKLLKKGGKVGLLAAGAYGLSTLFNDAEASESNINPNLVERETSNNFDASSSGPDMFDAGLTGASVMLAAPALKQTAKMSSGIAANIIAKRSASIGGKTIAKAVAGRTGLAMLGPIGAAIMAAWTAYDVLSLVWDWFTSPTKPDDFRIAAYGILPENTKHAEKILAFEKWMLEKSKFDPKTGEFIYPNTDSLKEAIPQFMSGKDGVENFMGQPKEIQSHYVKEFETWYEARFKPVFESHVKAMNEVNPKIKLTEAFGRLWKGDLDKGLILPWARRARITNVYDNPYNVSAYPFWVLEGSDEAEYRGIVVNKGMVDNFFNILAEEYKEDEIKLRKLDKLQMSISSRRGESYTSKFAFENQTGYRSSPITGNPIASATSIADSVLSMNKSLGNLMTINGKDVFALSKNSNTINKDYSIDDLTALRMRLYGLINLVDTRVRVLDDMEKTLVDYLKYDANGIASLEEFDYDKMISMYAPQLDWDIGNKEEHAKFLSWFKTRFSAVYLAYVTSIQKYKPNADPLEVVDTLDPSIRYSIGLDLANAMAILDGESVPVWKLPIGPIRDIEPNGDPGTIARNLEALKNLRESKVLTEKDPRSSLTQDSKLYGTSVGGSGSSLTSFVNSTVNTSSNMGAWVENLGLSGPNVTGPVDNNAGPAINPNEKRLNGISVNNYQGTGDIKGITWKDPGPSAWSNDMNKNFELLKDLFVQVSKVTGVDSGILVRMAKQESSFNPFAKAPTSSALGLYQFLNGTWDEMIPVLRQYGITNPDRKNPVHSMIAGAEYIKKNMKTIQGSVAKAGIPMDTTAVYTAHFMGPGGAKKFFNQMATNPNDPMDRVGNWGKVIDANKWIFRTNKGTGRVKTPIEVYNTLTQKMNVAESNRFAETVQKLAGQTVTTAQGSVASGETAATPAQAGTDPVSNNSTSSVASGIANMIPDLPTSSQTQSTATTSLFSGETQDISNNSTGISAPTESANDNSYNGYSNALFNSIPGLPTPGDSASVLGGYADNNNGTSLAKFPLESMTVTSQWNPKRMHPTLHVVRPHRGIDLRANESTKVFATGDGRVTFAGEMNGYGNIIIIAHPDGKETRYAHLSKFLVKQGDMVKAGQHIAMAGNTGIGSGPHLHFEVRRTQGTGPNNASDIDPIAAMNASGTKTLDGKDKTLTGGGGAPQEELAETKNGGTRENGVELKTSSEILGGLQNNTSGGPQVAQGIANKPSDLLSIGDMGHGNTLGNSFVPNANGNESMNYSASTAESSNYTPPPSADNARDRAYSQQQEKLFNKYSEQSEKMLNILNDQLHVQREMRDALKDVMSYITTNGGIGSNYVSSNDNQIESQNKLNNKTNAGTVSKKTEGAVKMSIGGSGIKIA